MKAQIILLLALVVALPSQAQKKSSTPVIRQFYKINRGHSFLEFSVLYMGYAKVKGRFTEFSGMFRDDENNLQNTSLSLTIKAESINTDLDWRDKDLKSDAWFDVEKFPFISFQSKKIIARENGFDVVGDLTIRDITKEVIIDMNQPSGVLADIRGDSQVIFTGTITIDRTEFGVAGDRWSKIKENIAGVGKDVEIEISILGKRMNERNLSNFFKNIERAHSKIYKAYNDAGLKAALNEFDLLKDEDERLSANTLQMVGQMLLLNDKQNDALAVFQRNVEAFPGNASVYLDLGEGYAEIGNLKLGVAAYEQALIIDPKNIYAIEILRHFK